MYSLYAEFPRQEICRKRQFSALLRWSGYQNALPVPVEKPTADWVQQHVVASAIPQNPNAYVDMTINAMLTVPDIQINIREHLNGFNSEATEAAMDAQVDGALAVVMPPFCASQVNQAMVDQWYIDHGFSDIIAAAGPPAPPPAPGVFSNPMYSPMGRR